MTPWSRKVAAHMVAFDLYFDHCGWITYPTLEARIYWADAEYVTLEDQ